jgi:hypothetical protein
VPQLVVERTEFNAGTIRPGTSLSADFVLQNKGRAPLTILDIKKDCGCTVPTCDPEIAAGGTGHLRVTLKIAGLYGAVEKHVYLETDDPKQASVAFTIKAVMPYPVEVTPGSDLVIPVTRGKAASAEVTLRSNDDDPLFLGPMDSPDPHITAEVAPGSVPQGREVKLRVTVAADAPSDAFETLLLVSTGHPRLPRLRFRIFGQPAGAVSVQPPRVAFGRVSPGSQAPIQRLLTLTRTCGAFRVLKAEDSLGCLNFLTAPEPDGASWTVQVTYLGGWKEERTQGVLRITTDDPARPVIEVPYTAEVW